MVYHYTSERGLSHIIGIWDCILSSYISIQTLQTRTNYVTYLDSRRQGDCVCPEVLWQIRFRQFLPSHCSSRMRPQIVEQHRLSHADRKYFHPRQTTTLRPCLQKVSIPSSNSKRCKITQLWYSRPHMFGSKIFNWS